jgi:DNA-directed RNA polymerase specialized sigma24 family protein
MTPIVMTAQANVETWLQQMAAGDPEGLAQLYDRYAPAVYAAALRVVKNLEEAEDTVQEVFADAWYEAGRLAAKGANAAEWLLAAARERAIARLHARGAGADTVSASTEAGLPPPTLRRRVLDSVYGAGERLPNLYPRPRLARRLFAWFTRRRSRASPDRSEEGET